MVRRYSEILSELRRTLRETEGDLAGQTAKELVCHFSHKSAAQLLGDSQLYASEELETELAEAVSRIRSGEPLAYVIEEWDFAGMTFHVTRDTLIPRDDTMAVADLAAEAAESCGEGCRILDLCTGTGCIGISLAVRLPKVRVTLADLSPEALRVAKDNIALHHVGGRVGAVSLNALEEPDRFLGDYDVIVSNPPYVTDREMSELPPSVKDYEPDMALRGGGDGLDFYRAIVRNFAPRLKPGGYLCFEFGMGQEQSVSEILCEGGFSVEELRRDERGIIRAVKGRKDSED